MLLQALLLAATVPLSYAQYGGGSGSSSTSSSSSASTTAAAASSSQSGVHNVVVGAGGAFAYQPDTLTAAVGDRVVFNFMPGSHSVAESTFAKPCEPATPGIWSGFFSPSSGTDSQVFVVTVNDTNPVWLYCAQIGHCNSGMAMVINPPSGGNTLASYKSAAAKAKLVAPTTVGGGVVEAASAVSSGSASSGSASSPSAAASTTAASPGAGSRYGLDALAAIGAGFIGLMML